MSDIKKRKSYSLKFKIDVLNEYEAGVSGKGWHSLSNKYGIGTSVLRGWFQQKSQLLKCLKDNTIQTRVARRLPGGGRKLEFEEIEKDVLEWVNERNRKGLRVKDKYIQIKAQTICATLRSNSDGTIYNNFKASTGWCERFKSRNNLVSRRQTTTKKLPENVQNIVKTFLQEIHDIIDKQKIKTCNVINFDQVPRYFESEHKMTITNKGAQSVLMKKANSGHKRFTATLAITMDGKFLKPHLLFSNLKKKPNVNIKCMVDVNKTGMFNDHILKNYLKEIILKRPQTSLAREPILLIMDSYGSHVKLHESKYLEKYNVFVVLIPPNLTGILQPLDVAINRSFQEYFNSRYDEYITNALENGELQTRHGNPKIPNYQFVSDWVVDWIASKNEGFVKNAFQFCGITSKESFSKEKLHSALQEILTNSFNYDEFIQNNPELPVNEASFFDTIDGIGDWFWPTEAATSFFACIHKIKQNNSLLDQFIQHYSSKLINFIKKHPDTTEILDEDDENLIKLGETSLTNLEIFAVSKLEKWNLKVTEIDENCIEISSFNYLAECSDVLKEIHLVKSGKYFGLQQ